MKSKKTKISEEHSFTVLYEPLRGGGYQITVPVLPGLVSFGRTFDEARSMARDAIQCYLGALKKEHAQIPIERSLLQERLSVAL